MACTCTFRAAPHAVIIGHICMGLYITGRGWRVYHSPPKGYLYTVCIYTYIYPFVDLSFGTWPQTNPPLLPLGRASRRVASAHSSVHLLIEHLVRTSARALPDLCAENADSNADSIARRRCVIGSQGSTVAWTALTTSQRTTPGMGTPLRYWLFAPELQWQFRGK